MIGYQFKNDYISQYPHIMSPTSKKISLSNIQRGYFDKSQVNFYVPPPLESYTHFSFQVYLLTFMAILFLQCLVISVTDKVFVETFPDDTKWWDRVIHSIGKSNIPFPFMYWHEGDGDCNEHIKRKKDTEYEVLLTICINLFFNMVLLFPLVILCKLY